MNSRMLTWVVLAILCLLLGYGCYLILQPFLGELFLALVLAIVIYPAYSWLERKTKRPTLAASVTTLATGLLFLLPVSIMGVIISQEIRAAIDAFNSAIGSTGSLEWFENAITFVSGKLGWDNAQTKEFLQTRIEWIGSTVLSNAVKSLQGLGSWIFSSVIALVTLFFLFRGGAGVVEQSKSWVPLPPRMLDELYSEIRVLMFANVYGVLAVAVVQGGLTGIGFWFSGLASPVFWGFVAGLLSVLPFIGSAFVWGPAVLYLFSTGATTSAIILLVYGFLIVSNADNVIRPIILSESAKMNAGVMFFALLGGMQAFGLIGLFAGPLVLSMAIAVARLLREYASAVQSSESESSRR